MDSDDKAITICVVSACIAAAVIAWAIAWNDVATTQAAFEHGYSWGRIGDTRQSGWRKE